MPRRMKTGPGGNIRSEKRHEGSGSIHPSGAVAMGRSVMRPVSRSAAHQRSPAGPAGPRRTIRQWGMGLDGPWVVPTFFSARGFAPTGYAFLSGAYGHGGHI